MIGRTLSRRRLLELCLALVPGLAGARLLAPWLPASAMPEAVGPDGRGATPAGSDATPWDPAAHQWAFAVDTTRCIGCGHCVDACKLENHVAAEPQYNRTWVERHVVATDGTVFVDAPEAGINGFPPESTAPGAAGVEVRQSFFVPRLCMQCDNAPCVSVCPVGATYKTPDGVVLVDQDRCIGCGYCVVACPYGARYLVPSGPDLPNGNAGVADKCTWCYQRLAKGQLPACVEECPTQARLFGDLNDPDSPVSVVLRTKRTEVMKPELGTRPRVFYVGLQAERG
jgi:Fe-S-cluster-containing dehydrogenase component